MLIATDGGVFRLDGEIRREEGPPAAAYLATAGRRAFALTRDGALWVRTEAGAWTLVNPHAIADELWSFAADPRLEGRLYAGVSPALLHRSDDGGRTWKACESVRRIPGYERWTFPPPPHVPHVRSIAPDPRAAGAVYIGVEEGGVYRSPDGGETWESLNDGLYWDVHTIAPALDAERLCATTGAGFHLSEDGGRHWRRITAGLDRSYTVPCVVTDHRLYVAAATGPPPTWRDGVDAGLYRSDDGGQRWTRLDGGLPRRFDTMVNALTVASGGSVYAAAGGALWARERAGEHWRLVRDDLPTIHALTTGPD